MPLMVGEKKLMKEIFDPQKAIEDTALAFPICEYCFGDTAQLPFSDKVWFICETDCERYGHSWACPPYCVDIQEKIAACKNYRNFSRNFFMDQFRLETGIFVPCVFNLCNRGICR